MPPQSELHGDNESNTVTAMEVKGQESRKEKNLSFDKPQSTTTADAHNNGRLMQELSIDNPVLTDGHGVDTNDAQKTSSEQVEEKEGDVTKLPLDQDLNRDQPNFFVPEIGHSDSIVKTISEIDSSCEGKFESLSVSDDQSSISEQNQGSNIIETAEDEEASGPMNGTIAVKKGVSFEREDPSSMHSGTQKNIKGEDESSSGADSTEKRASQLNYLQQQQTWFLQEQQRQQDVYQKYAETAVTVPPPPPGHPVGHNPLLMMPSQHMGGVMLPHMQAQMQAALQPQMHFMPHQQTSPSMQPMPIPAMYPHGGAYVMDRSSFTAQPHQQMVTQPPSQQQAKPLSQPSRKRITLHLVEKQESLVLGEGKKSIFSMLKRPKSRSVGSSDEAIDDIHELMKDIQDIDSPKRIKKYVERGEMSISWYAGTTATELQDHVRNSVESKLRLSAHEALGNLRVLDETIEPYEEIVLSPFIPDGSKFLLTFRIKDISKKVKARNTSFRAPPSPSAAPSPPGELEQHLQRQITEVLTKTKKEHRRAMTAPFPFPPGSAKLDLPDFSTPSRSSRKSESKSENNTTEKSKSVVGSLSMNDMAKMQAESQNDPQSDYNSSDTVIAERLDQLNKSLRLLQSDGQHASNEDKKTEKKQVVFVLANYFVLFLSLIAISAEIHERAPTWIEYINENVDSVKNCSVDRDALFECVSEGNFSGLIASVILYASQSVATKRFFLFGFDSPQKLWTVVYEAGVTALCWGTSYLAIRRGLNPDTRPNCLRKYWKDAVYGSLAGFNAAFLKAVLKNLLPKADEVFDVMDGRQLHLVKQIGKLFKAGAEL